MPFLIDMKNLYKFIRDFNRTVEKTMPIFPGLMGVCILVGVMHATMPRWGQPPRNFFVILGQTAVEIFGLMVVVTLFFMLVTFTVALFKKLAAKAE